MIDVLGQGILMGMAIAAPVGPIGVLCIRYTLTQGRLTGLIAGLGAATADGMYGCIAAFGLSTIATTLVKNQQISQFFEVLIHQKWMVQWIGAAFLCYLGIKTLRLAAKPSRSLIVTAPDPNGLEPGQSPPISGKAESLLQVYGLTLLLTLANPATILSFTAIFVGLGITHEADNHGTALTLVLGVFSGSVLWWLLLSTTVGLMRDRLTKLPIVWINRLSGAVILGFGILALVAHS